jgi:hypothetical protein
MAHPALVLIVVGLTSKREGARGDLPAHLRRPKAFGHDGPRRGLDAP